MALLFLKTMAYMLKETFSSVDILSTSEEHNNLQQKLYIGHTYVAYIHTYTIMILRVWLLQRGPGFQTKR